MKRKFIVGIISFVLVLFSALNVHAVNNTVYLNVVKNTDNTVVATLTVDVLDKGLDALSGKINYDKEKLEFVKVKENVTGDVTISIVDLVGATSEDKKINWDGLTATVKVDGNNNEQNGNNNNEGNNENNDGNNTENNNENDNIGNGGNNSEENGNNNGNINNDNNGEHVQNNENNDSNNGNMAVFLIVAILIVLYIRSKINKEK